MEKHHQNQFTGMEMEAHERHEEAPPPPYVPEPIHHNKSLPEIPPLQSRDDGPSHERDFSTPVYHTRDPRKLIGYLIPFPKPLLEIPTEDMPSRFLIYTPPPPPLKKPAEGEKEGMAHKFQRKWQQEVREAKDTTVERTRWQNIKSKSTRGVEWAINQTTTSNVDFLIRVDAGSDKKKDKGKKKEHQRSDSAQTSTTSQEQAAPDAEPKRLSEIILAYPHTLAGTPESVREEFVDKTLRTKSKTQRDAIIATGLLPVSIALDILMTPILPFVPLMQVNGAWAFFAIRGNKAAGKAAKQMAMAKQDDGVKDAGKDGGGEEGGAGGAEKEKEKEERIHFTFRPAPGLEVLQRYLAARCYEKDEKLFAAVDAPPTEEDLLEAIGWASSQTGDEGSSEGEVADVKEDLRQVMAKAAKEWKSWCKTYAKNPKKAAKK